jgi:hypothetical protein
MATYLGSGSGVRRGNRGRKTRRDDLEGGHFRRPRAGDRGLGGLLRVRRAEGGFGGGGGDGTIGRLEVRGY